MEVRGSLTGQCKIFMLCQPGSVKTVGKQGAHRIFNGKPIRDQKLKKASFILEQEIFKIAKILIL